MVKNVVDMLGEKLEALSVQCEVRQENDFITCTATNNPTPEYFDVDWEIEIDTLKGWHLRRAGFSKLAPTLDHDLVYFGGPGHHDKMKCMPRLGSGRGNAELVCSPRESDLNRWHKDWEGSKIDLRKRNLKFEKR